MSVEAESTVSKEWIVFENQGEKLFGILHRPEKVDAEVPAVILLHGFASHKVGTNRSHVHLANSLAASGVACFRFDFRGAGDSDGNLAQMSIDDLISDANAAIDYLETVPGVDPNRLGLMGSSLGGSIAVAVASKRASIKSLALWAPVASGMLWFQDWLSRHGQGPSVDPSEALATYQGVRIHPSFREQFGKFHPDIMMGQLGNVPLLHMHGEEDDVISLIHQRSYVEQRRQATAKTEFVVFPGVGHVMGTANVLNEIQERSAAWFKESL